MPTDRQATFEVTSWDESPFDEGGDGAKLTRAVVRRAYSGDLEGASTTQWLMAHADDGSATFVGLERFDGRIGDDTGTLVLRHVGTYEDGAATAALAIITGAGTGELTGVTGTGEFRADPAGVVSLHLADH